MFAFSFNAQEKYNRFLNVLIFIFSADQWLIAFLRGCKFSLERSKEKMDMYYTLKTIVPEFFANRDPLDDRIQEILKIG